MGDLVPSVYKMINHVLDCRERNLSMKMRHLQQQFSVAPDRYLVAPVC